MTQAAKRGVASAAWLAGVARVARVPDAASVAGAPHLLPSAAAIRCQRAPWSRAEPAPWARDARPMSQCGPGTRGFAD